MLLKKTEMTDTSRGTRVKDSTLVYPSNANLDTIFVSYLPENALLKDLWSFFKKLGSIKDIILPKKKDKYGRRFGFIKARSREEAANVLGLIEEGT